MPAGNQENLMQWLDQSTVDYFTCFVKAWIPFNAWYRYNYPSIQQERQILDAIKSDGNRMRSRFIARIDQDGTEGEELRHWIAILHKRLANDPLNSPKMGLVSFENVFTGYNTKNSSVIKIKHWFYKVEKITSPQKKYVATVTSNRGREDFRLEQEGDWDLERFSNDARLVAYNKNDQAYLIDRYKEINPKVYVSLLCDNEECCVILGEYKFTSDKEALFAGLIEILYCLRNMLFHGELVPDKTTNSTYEPAYHILRRLMRYIVGHQD